MIDVESTGWVRTWCGTPLVVVVTFIGTALDPHPTPSTVHDMRLSIYEHSAFAEVKLATPDKRGEAFTRHLTVPGARHASQ